MTFTTFLLASSPLALVLPVFTGVRYFKQLPKPYKVISIHVWGAAIAEVTCYILWWYNKNNLFMFPFFTLWEFEMISLFYVLLLKNIAIRHIIPFLMVLFALLTFADIRFVNGLTHFNSYSRSIEGIIVIGYAIAYFYKILSELEVIRLERDPAFWISVAFLVYFSGSLFLFIFGDYVIHHSYNTYGVYWGMHTIIMWILYTMIAIGLWSTSKA